MAHTGFMLAEEEALKALLRGLTVQDPTKQSGRKGAMIRFNWPMPEAQRTYPMGVVTFLDVTPNWEEQSSAQTIVPTYWPDTIPDLQGTTDANHAITSVEFMPVYLMYQLSTWAVDPFQDRDMKSQIQFHLIPWRWGSLYVPADDTVRRLELLDSRSSPYALTGANGNREEIYRSIYTFRINAEIPIFAYAEILRAQAVKVNVETMEHEPLQSEYLPDNLGSINP